MGKLQEYRALNIQKDGTGKEIWMPVARNGLQNKEPIEILAQFNGEIRGIYNYYRLARKCICPEQVLLCHGVQHV